MFTNKRSLFFLTTTVILSLWFTACGSSQSVNTNEEQVTTSGTNNSQSITILIAEDPPSFNPMVADTGYDALVMELVLLELTQQLIAEMLGEIGIQMDIIVVEGSVLWDLSDSGGIEQSGNFDIDIWDDGYAGVDPTDYVWETYSIAASEPDLGWNFFRWQNDVVVALINEAYTLDEQTRQGTFCAIGDLINEEVPVIHLFTVPNANAYSTRITGMQSSVNDLVTWNIADWALK